MKPRLWTQRVVKVILNDKEYECEWQFMWKGVAVCWESRVGDNGVGWGRSEDVTFKSSRDLRDPSNKELAILLGNVLFTPVYDEQCQFA